MQCHFRSLKILPIRHSTDIWLPLVQKPFHKSLQQPIERLFIHLLYHWLVLITLTREAGSPPASHLGSPSPWPSTRSVQEARASNLDLHSKIERKGATDSIQQHAAAKTLLWECTKLSRISRFILLWTKLYPLMPLNYWQHRATLQLLNMYTSSASENRNKEYC